MSGQSVVVGRSAIGRGVFAAQYFQPGQPILTFGGLVLSTSEMLALGPDRAYALQVGPVFVPSPDGLLPFPIPPEILTRTMSAGKERLEECARAVEGEPVLLEGRIDEALRQLVEARDAALVVIGSRGESGLRRLLFGSSAERIVRQLRCSVMVVPLNGGT